MHAPCARDARPSGIAPAELLRHLQVLLELLVGGLPLCQVGPQLPLPALQALRHLQDLPQHLGLLLDDLAPVRPARLHQALLQLPKFLRTGPLLLLRHTEALPELRLLHPQLAELRRKRRQSGLGRFVLLVHLLADLLAELALLLQLLPQLLRQGVLAAAEPAPAAAQGRGLAPSCGRQRRREPAASGAAWGQAPGGCSPGHQHRG
mmetsp:Transcript_39730/g.123765  ORF Transcript_39730/g.123765 Transcript_39730/m.123765 type:complete len:206 (+) Transcript_39730:1-618(+)